MQAIAKVLEQLSSAHSTYGPLAAGPPTSEVYNSNHTRPLPFSHLFSRPPSLPPPLHVVDY